MKTNKVKKCLEKQYSTLFDRFFFLFFFFGGVALKMRYIYKLIDEQLQKM